MNPHPYQQYCASPACITAGGNAQSIFYYEIEAQKQRAYKYWLVKQTAETLVPTTAFPYQVLTTKR